MFLGNEFICRTCPVWAEFPGFTPSREWTYSTIATGAYPVWFRVGYVVPDPGVSRLLFCTASIYLPREHHNVIRLFPQSTHFDVIRVEVPPSFEGSFNFAAKEYRYYNPSQPVSLTFAFWNA